MRPPRLKTARLLLREFRPEDVAPHAEAALDEEAQRFLGGVKTPYESFAGLATHAGHWALRGYGGWIVERREDGAFLGRVGLFHPEGWPGVEVGWKLARPAWGKGYAPEAAAAAIGWAWTALDLPELISLIVADNANSQRVAQKLGEANTGPVETPFGTADRWLIRRPEGDAPWALRDATLDDAPRLALQLREAMERFRDFSPPGWPVPDHTTDDEVEALKDPNYRCVVAEPGGVLAGHVSWRPAVDALSGPDDPDTAYLGQLYVEPAWWGSPLATKLMDIAIARAGADGFQRMHLVTPAAQGRARRFYERCGWRTVAPPVDDARFGMPTIAYARDLDRVGG
ncbi:acetyltransferase [Baekduia alba]|uniref:GNAT family N-acetyltransferase n=1 Tax=Baekduia alba TaxID=2997333 RepID=UPI0023422F08|nr:GNAT family N-acetyltransferase [Baekduia alba]WCB91658.1 acetyltransferase [Baekduia alba]